ARGLLNVCHVHLRCWRSRDRYGSGRANRRDADSAGVSDGSAVARVPFETRRLCADTGDCPVSSRATLERKRPQVEGPCVSALRSGPTEAPRSAEELATRITNVSSSANYRGRLAPSPTGLLHLGHARTFSIAAQRAAEHHGMLILRNEDLDPQRSRPEFATAMLEDLHWLGIRWDEGPDCGGPHVPYAQSERRGFYLEAWQRLRDGGFIYPCTCS